MQVLFNNPNIYINKNKRTLKQNHTSISSSGTTALKHFNLPNYAQCISFRSTIDEERLYHSKKLQNIINLLHDKTGSFSLNKASELIKNTIDAQLMLYTENDIKLAIKQVQEKHPDASREYILKTMATLSNFSNYESMSAIKEYLEQEKYLDVYNTSNLTLNNLITYFANKSIINYHGFIDINNETMAMFVDKYTIEYLKELQAKDKEEFNKIKKDILEKRIKLVIIDGWEAKTKNGYKSFNVAGEWGNLAETVSDIIEQEKQIGKKSVYINYLYDDLVSLFGYDFDFDIIRNSPKGVIDEKTIAKRLNTKTINTEEIKNLIEQLSDYIIDTKPRLNKQRTNETICKFLLSTINEYSPRRMAKELKELHQKVINKTIELGKNPKDIIFLIPDNNKSFGLTNYQYSKANNIPYYKYAQVNKSTHKINKRTTGDYVVVLCDDFAGTGASLTLEQIVYETFKERNQKATIIFAPLVYTQLAKESIENKLRTMKKLGRKPDGFVGNNLTYDYSYAIDFLPIWEKKIFSSCFDKGYGDMLLSIAFQHVIPDNCSDLSSYILEKLLVSQGANKVKIDPLKRKEIESPENRKNESQVLSQTI